jgi:cytochrome c-type biogenesis protein CcmH/NrfG
LAQSPSDFVASNNLALSLIEDDKDKGAYQAKQQRALEYAVMNARQYPKQAEAFSTLGWVYYKVNRLNEAWQCLQNAAALGPISPDTAFYLATVLKAGDKPEGTKQAKQILEGILKGKATFSTRKDAETLLNSMK